MALLRHAGLQLASMLVHRARSDIVACLASSAPLSGRFRAEARRTFADPIDKLGDARMIAERFDCVEGSCQFSFAQRCVYFVVADLVEPNRFSPFATAQFRDKVVQALLNVSRYWPVAQGADRIVAHRRHLE